jgi:hypothetical protein
VRPFCAQTADEGGRSGAQAMTRPVRPTRPASASCLGYLPGPSMHAAGCNAEPSGWWCQVAGGLPGRPEPSVPPRPSTRWL